MRNRWSLFFKVRGGIPKYNLSCKGELCLLEMSNSTFPNSVENTNEFVSELHSLTSELYALRVAGDPIGVLLRDNKMMDSLFLIEEGRDWIVGMSRDAYLVYLANDSLVEELKQASDGAAVILEDPSKLHIGYNLILCRVDGGSAYDCKVGGEGEGITLSLMSEWKQFINPTDEPIIIKQISEEVDVSKEYREKFEGTYGLSQNAGFISLFEYDSSLWIDAPSLFDLGFPWDKSTKVRLFSGIKEVNGDRDTVFYSPYFSHPFEVHFIDSVTLLFTTLPAKPIPAQKVAEVDSKLKLDLESHYERWTKSEVALESELWIREGHEVLLKMKSDTLVLRDLDANILDWPLVYAGNRIWKSADLLFSLEFKKDNTGSYTLAEYYWENQRALLYSENHKTLSASLLSSQHEVGLNVKTLAFEEGGLLNEACGDGKVIGNSDLDYSSWTKEGFWSTGDTLSIRVLTTDSTASVLELNVCVSEEFSTKLSVKKKINDSISIWVQQSTKINLPIGRSQIRIDPILAETDSFTMELVMEPVWKGSKDVLIDSWVFRQEFK